MYHQLRFIFSVFLFLFWPGICLLWLTKSWWMFRLRFSAYGSLHLALPASFGISLGLISLMGWIGNIFGLGFYDIYQLTFYIIILLSIGSLALLVYFYVVKQNPISVALERYETPKNLWINAGIGLLVLIITLVATYAGTWFSHTADSFSHIAAIRSLWVFDRPLPQEIFFSKNITAISPTHGTWHLALAFVANNANIGAETIWRYATVLVAPLTALTFAVLGLILSQRYTVAFLATLLYLVFEFLGTNYGVRVAAQPNRMGHMILWLVIIFTVAYAQVVSPKPLTNKLVQRGNTFYARHINLLFIALIAFGLSAIHMMYTPGLIILLAGTFAVLAAAYAASTGIRLLVNGSNMWLKQAATWLGLERLSKIISKPGINNSSPRRLLIASALAVATVIPAFIYKSIIILFSYPKTSFTSSPAQITESTGNWLGTIDLSFWYPAILSVPVLVTFLLLLLANDWIRKRPGAAVTVAGVLLVPAATIIFPIVLGSGGQVFVTIIRLAKLMPALVYVALGWQLVLIGGWLATLFKHPPERLTWGPIKPVLAFAVLLVAGYILTQALKDPLLIYSPDSDYRFSLKVSQKSDLTVAWADALEQMEQLPLHSTILSDINTAYMLAGLTGLPFTGLPSQHVAVNEKFENLKAYHDTVDFMAGDLSPTEMVQVLEQHQVDYVFIGQPRYSGETAWQLLPWLPILSPVNQGGDWMLLRYDPEKKPAFFKFVEERGRVNNTADLVKFYQKYQNSPLFDNQPKFLAYVANDLTTNFDDTYPLLLTRYLTIGQVTMADKLYNQAINDYKFLLTLMSGNRAVSAQLANSYLSLGQRYLEHYFLTDQQDTYARIAYLYQQAFTLDPANADLQRGTLQTWLTGFTPSASQERYLTLAANNPALQENIIQAMLETGQSHMQQYLATGEQTAYQQAMEQYSTLFLMAPDNPAVRQALLQAYLSQPEPSPQEELLYLMIANDQFKLNLNIVSQAWLGLGQRYVELAQAGDTGNSEDLAGRAGAAYQTALNLDPTNLAARQAIVDAYTTLGETAVSPALLDETLALYRRDILAAASNNPNPTWQLAAAYQQLGQTDEALALYAQAAAANPERADAQARLGQAYQKAGQLNQAMIAYQQALRLKPDWGELYPTLGNLYQTQQQPKQAVSLYQEAAAQWPEQAWPHLELGQMYLEAAGGSR